MTEVQQLPSLLFVCTGNTCRSVMAEFLTRRRFGNAVNVCSAGIRPGKTEDAKNAIETLREHFSIDASGHVPRDVKTLALDAFDHIIALDKDAVKKLKALSKREIIVRDIDDPYGDDLLRYKKCALEIMQLVGRLGPVVSKNEKKQDSSDSRGRG